jgi:hypothetical protein
LRGQEIGHAQPEASAALLRPSRSVDEQCQTGEDICKACQQLGCLIGEQTQRWSGGRQREHGAGCIFVAALQAHGIVGPSCRYCHLQRRPQLEWEALSDGLCLVPRSVERHLLQACRNAAPAIKRRKQAVLGRLQCTRVVTQLAGLPDRQIDDRVERYGATGELAPHSPGWRQLCPCACQHVCKSACYFCSEFSDKRRQLPGRAS